MKVANDMEHKSDDEKKSNEPMEGEDVATLDQSVEYMMNYCNLVSIHAYGVRSLGVVLVGVHVARKLHPQN